MTTKTPIFKSPLRLALGVKLACLAPSAAAFDFSIYEIDASFSTTLTVGTAYRLEDQDKSLITQGNLGP